MTVGNSVYSAGVGSWGSGQWRCRGIATGVIYWGIVPCLAFLS